MYRPRPNNRTPLNGVIWAKTHDFAFYLNTRFTIEVIFLNHSLRIAAFQNVLSDKWVMAYKLDNRSHFPLFRLIVIMQDCTCAVNHAGHKRVTFPPTGVAVHAARDTAQSFRRRLVFVPEVGLFERINAGRAKGACWAIPLFSQIAGRPQTEQSRARDFTAISEG